VSELAARIDARPLGVALAAAAVAFAVGLVTGLAPLPVPLLLAAALIVAAVAFLRTELAIHLLIVSMLLSPEFTVGGALGTGSLDASRSAVIRIEDLLLVIIGFAWLAKISVHKQLGLILRTPLNTAIAVYAVVLCSATVLGMAAGRVRPMLGLLFVGKYLEYFVIYFLVVNHTRDRRALIRMSITAGATAVLVALIALVQIPSGERVTAPFEGPTGEPNTLGGYLVLMMAVLGGMALEAPRRATRLALGAVVGLLAVPLLFTLSRSSWLAAGATALVLLAVTRRRRLLLGVLILAAGLLWLSAPGDVVERVAYTFTEHRESVQVGGVVLDPSASERIRSWEDAFEGFSRLPLLGHGVTGYGFIDAQYFRILAETGLLGLLAFGCVIFLLARQTWRAATTLESPLWRGMSAGFLAATAGLLVHSIGANTFVIVRIMEPFWLFAGLVMVAPLIERSEKREAGADAAR
jgi:O-antigen ligase